MYKTFGIYYMFFLNANIGFLIFLQAFYAASATLWNTQRKNLLFFPICIPINFTWPPCNHLEESQNLDQT